MIYIIKGYLYHYKIYDKNISSIQVIVLKDDVIIGHVLYNPVPRLSQFLRRKVNKAFAEVTEEKENEK